MPSLQRVRPPPVGFDGYEVVLDPTGRRSEEDLLVDALGAARASSRSHFGHEGGYTLLFHGPSTRRRPLPHVHIVPAGSPSQRHRRLLLVGCKRVVWSLVRGFAYPLQVAQDLRDLAGTWIARHQRQDVGSGERRALERRLTKTWRTLGAEGEPPARQLLAAWLQPWRHYHGVSHLQSLLAEIERLNVTEEERAVLEVAAWFHDAVLIPMRSDNELRSAKWAREALESAGLPGVAQHVHTMILATQHHRAHEDWLTALFLDLDLSVLGAAPEAYARYVDGVRLEFWRFRDASWARGRTRVLQRLRSGGVYQTPRFRAKLESAARRNLEDELRRLEAR